ncbi:abnormal spindle-like microcephaly-associated -like protein [Brachionus plicatilis]|uniref:Abnormal spindle-like microcephaly-associated-like protein n=1 Tax=Brachionus plicatilis TaxID=10195 RepID=A0A3M7PQG8_BRAPC|nr:abnormal spindle-like microcephaly-associated -like protein [Brachionus plicatilis]
MAKSFSYDFYFNSSPTKKSVGDVENEENILVLAPFTKRPKINFGKIKINDSANRSLVLINSQTNDLDVVISSEELKINNIELKIEKGKSTTLKLTWQPNRPGNFNFVLQIEAINIPKLKFVVSAFGVCCEPTTKKCIRKPLKSIQTSENKQNSSFENTKKLAKPIVFDDANSKENLA